MKIEKFCKEIEEILRENTTVRLSFHVNYDVYEFNNYERLLTVLILADAKTGIKDERTKDFFSRKFKNEKQVLKALKECFVPVQEQEKAFEII